MALQVVAEGKDENEESQKGNTGGIMVRRAAANLPVNIKSAAQMSVAKENMANALEALSSARPTYGELLAVISEFHDMNRGSVEFINTTMTILEEHKIVVSRMHLREKGGRGGGRGVAP